MLCALAAPRATQGLTTQSGAEGRPTRFQAAYLGLLAVAPVGARPAAPGNQRNDDYRRNLGMEIDYSSVVHKPRLAMARLRCGFRP
ncbi:hypothetical protein [Kibdelosporangium philippinense]|uniref:hypothetical protein n=1 Tax=Kibdelosporangium philippinense TaxID=211113 RepID=UPI003610BF75